MSYYDTLKVQPEATLFQMLDDVPAGMLGLSGSDQGFQPMTHFPDPKAGLIWFIASTETDLVKRLGSGTEAEYIFATNDHEGHAYLHGRLNQIDDPFQLDALWTLSVADWFKDGRRDPTIALLRFVPMLAQIWVADGSAVKFWAEVLLSDVDRGQKPDIGVKATIRFPIMA